MALPPKFADQKLVLGAEPVKAINTIELYLDYVCPFSAKMFKTLDQAVFSSQGQDHSYLNHVQFIFRQQIQPWHPSSTLVHEAAAAVLRLDPENFWFFSTYLMDEAKSYYDVSVVDETRNKTYERLTKLAADHVGINAEKMMDLLRVSDKPGQDGSLNSGNGVTDDIKLMVKMNRLTGVHVTPTVVFNGVVENSISSSFTAEQWHEWLTKNCT